MLWILLLVLPLAASPCGLRGDFVMLTEGVSGGYAPAMPTLRLLIVRRADGSAAVYRADAQGRYTEGVASEYRAPVGLRDLPHEGGSGWFDLYGRKTALHWHDGGRCWFTQPPNGCLTGPPSMQVTDEQKAAFDRAVRGLEEQGAVARAESSAERFGTAFTSLVGR